MKSIFLASAFACVFSISTFAGEIPSDGKSQPPSPQTSGPTLLGEIPSGDRADSLSDAALSAILTALGLASF